MNHAAAAAATAAQIRFVSVTCAAVKCSLICPIVCADINTICTLCV